jgi:hypothetical protein
MGVLYVHPDVLDNGLAELLKTNQVAVLKSYALADPHATVTNSANVVLTDVITSADMSLSNLGTHDRKWQCNGKSTVKAIVVTANTDDLHIAYIDTLTSRVLFVTDEMTDQEITLENNVDVPAGEYQSIQPTAI